ncbi:MAG TPA: fertility inhibition FinO-like protein [Coleofasciculaceae cyanobacterium]
MPVPGKLELTIKINEFPADVQTVENGWKQFEIDCDGQLVRIKVKPKVFKKLEQAQENYPMWVAAIAGKMGEPTDDGFVLDQPTIQVFERKPKEPKEPQEAATTAAS